MLSPQIGDYFYCCKDKAPCFTDWYLVDKLKNLPVLLEQTQALPPCARFPLNRGRVEMRNCDTETFEVTICSLLYQTNVSLVSKYLIV